MSEMAKSRPDERVIAWVSGQDRSTIFICSVLLMEQVYGAEIYRLKVRSDRFYRAIDNMISGLFRNHIVEWNSGSAKMTGKLRAWREAIGRPISAQDAMIAVVCLSHGATLATRNTKDFEGLDLKLANPFEGG